MFSFTVKSLRKTFFFIKNQFRNKNSFIADCSEGSTQRLRKGFMCQFILILAIHSYLKLNINTTLVSRHFQAIGSSHQSPIFSTVITIYTIFAFWYLKVDHN